MQLDPRVSVTRWRFRLLVLFFCIAFPVAFVFDYFNDRTPRHIQKTIDRWK